MEDIINSTTREWSSKGNICAECEQPISDEYKSSKIEDKLKDLKKQLAELRDTHKQSQETLQADLDKLESHREKFEARKKT